MSDIKPITRKKTLINSYNLYYTLGIAIGFILFILFLLLFINLAGKASLNAKPSFSAEHLPTYTATESPLIPIKTSSLGESFTEPKATVAAIAGDALQQFVQSQPGHYEIVLIAKNEPITVSSRDEILAPSEILTTEEVFAGYELMAQIMRNLFESPELANTTQAVAIRLAGIAKFSNDENQTDIKYDVTQGSLSKEQYDNIQWDTITMDEFRFLVSDIPVMNN